MSGHSNGVEPQVVTHKQTPVAKKEGETGSDQVAAGNPGEKPIVINLDDDDVVIRLNEVRRPPARDYSRAQLPPDCSFCGPADEDTPSRPEEGQSSDDRKTDGDVTTIEIYAVTEATNLVGGRAGQKATPVDVSLDDNVVKKKSIRLSKSSALWAKSDATLVTETGGSNVKTVTICKRKSTRQRLSSRNAVIPEKSPSKKKRATNPITPDAYSIPDNVNMTVVDSNSRLIKRQLETHLLPKKRGRPRTQVSLQWDPQLFKYLRSKRKQRVERFPSTTECVLAYESDETGTNGPGSPSAPFHVRCKGCDRLFEIPPVVDIKEGQEREKEKETPDPQSHPYIIHCLDECDKYQALGLIKTCRYCSERCIDDMCLRNHLKTKHREQNEEDKGVALRGVLIHSRRKQIIEPKSMTSDKQIRLLDSRWQCSYCDINGFGGKAGLSRHIKTHHQDKFDAMPKWMPLEFIQKAAEVICFPDRIECEGCRLTFPFNMERNCFSAQFYVHCIEGCPEYKRLELIEDCFDCGMKFLNIVDFLEHNRVRHQGVAIGQKKINKAQMKRLNMFPLDFFEGGTPSSEIKACPKCEMPFECFVKKGKTIPCLDFFIHCLDECKTQCFMLLDCLECPKRFLCTEAFEQHTNFHLMLKRLKGLKSLPNVTLHYVA